MSYRFRFHWYIDPDAPLIGGRALAGRTTDQAVAHAVTLWNDGAYPAALGCLVMDTEEGEVVWRSERGGERAGQGERHGGVRLASTLRRGRA
jgi:hypothetical protein